MIWMFFPEDALCFPPAALHVDISHRDISPLVILSVVGHLHICEGTSNTERYMQVLEHQPHFFGDVPAYFTKTMPRHVLHELQQHGLTVKECGC